MEIQDKKQALLGLSLEELTKVALGAGLPKFAGRQLADWLYKHRVTEIDEMTNISKQGRERLKESYWVGRSLPVKSVTSRDGTRKYLFKTDKGAFIEAVMIPDGDRRTLCISSQVGCKMNCLFCQTGKQGFSGQLLPHEILNQLFSVEESLEMTNIVFMGMGEPLDNVDRVLSTIEILTSSYGLAWSPKRITLSTIGLKKGLERFLSETHCHLALSVHDPFPEERKELMPIEKASPIREVMELVSRYDFSGQRRLSIEYIIFRGVNDSKAHAEALVRLIGKTPCRVNLIPYHKIPNVALSPAEASEMEAFKQQIERHGLTCTIRTSRGQDIDAACGMLSTKEQMLA